MEAVPFFVLSALLGLWLAFWVIRLAVRYGADDALRKHRAWIDAQQDRSVR